jgi:tagatose 6-phosphate kinase
MILTVTLNAALDVTYRVPALVPGRTHRVTEVAERPGGKGLNVARVLHALGEPVVATGLVGGACGERIRSLLAAEGVRDAFVAIAAESRRTVVVADGTRATGLWEPGPTVRADEWSGFLRRFAALACVARVVVLSGSLPPGVPADGYAVLVDLARSAGAQTVLDADGAALRHGLAAGPDLVKPNAEELAGLVGRPVSAANGIDPVKAVGEVRSLGAREAVASLGSAGLVAATADGVVRRAFLPEPVAGNPTGAGDACVAALARGMIHRHPWPERLRDAVALSAAAVVAPVAGSVNLPDYRRLRRTAIIEEV